MIFYVQGLLTIAGPHFAVIEAAGVGYLLHISLMTYPQLPPLSSPCRLYAVMVMRDQSQTLYGFLRTEEQRLFGLLLTVSGIGPKLAMALLSHYPYQTIADAIYREDVKTLSAVPGIGKKSAQRLILDLRDKVSRGGYFSAADAVDIDIHGLLQQATAALMTLGYSEATAQRAAKGALTSHDDATTLSSVITRALQLIQ